MWMLCMQLHVECGVLLLDLESKWFLPACVDTCWICEFMRAHLRGGGLLHSALGVSACVSG